MKDVVHRTARRQSGFTLIELLVVIAIITSRGHHSGMVQVALMDGSARSVSENIDLALWRRLGTRAGGEVPGEF